MPGIWGKTLAALNLSTRSRVTMASLVAAGVLHEEWTGTLTDSREAYWARLFSDEPPHATEPQVTRFMTMLGGETEATVIRYFCEVSGVQYKPAFRLISGSEFGRNYHKRQKGSLQSIDLVVVDSEIWGEELLRKTAPGGGARIAIECKFDASINATWCTNHGAHEKSSTYSNQLICYPAGCTNEALAARAVSFVWLGLPRAKQSAAWPPATAVTREWIELRRRRNDSERLIEQYEAVLTAQDELGEAGTWSMAWWPELYRRVESLFDGDDAEVGTAVLRAMGARPPRWPSR